MFMEDSLSKVIFSVSQNHFSLQFYVANSRSHPIHIIAVTSHARIGLFPTKNHEKCENFNSSDGNFAHYPSLVFIYQTVSVTLKEVQKLLT